MSLRGKKVIAFHSYKGGTGKTTVISNLAASYAMQGRSVCLLDLDVYAPSLYAYFGKEPKLWLNDVLSGDADIEECLVDISAELGTKGKMTLALSSPRKDDVYAFEALQDKKWQFAALKRFLMMKDELISKFGYDYVLLDTSPGIHYWSINALVAADVLILMSKYMNMDLEGTRKMVANIYDALSRFGSKSFVVLNRVEGSGFSFLQGTPVALYASDSDKSQKREAEVMTKVDLPVLASIPCYCDIQFDPHEFLFALKNPVHPFSKAIETIGKSIDQLD